MNKGYILINNEKLNRSNWQKWLLLILAYCLSGLFFSAGEDLLANIIHVNLANIMVVTFYIRGFIVLSLIHDLAPRFRKSISILWSLIASFIYIGIDSKSGDVLYLGSLLFFATIIAYNIFLYKKASSLKSTKDKRY